MSTESSGFRRFFSNPMVGFVGSIASIIGLGLAVYFYIEARETRELRYFVNPARAVVVHAGQTSRLSITLDGAPVKRDVSAAQVAFWNEGRASIKPNNVLQSLVVKTSPMAPIIEATVRKRSREVVKIDLDRSLLTQGELTVHWNILEFHDGGVLQLIYLGDVNAPVNARATIEGQGELPEASGTQNTWWLILALGLANIGVILLAIAISTHGWINENKNRFRVIAVLAMLVAICGIAVYYTSHGISSGIGPPFGF
jgi:hypothetical protein